MDDSGAPSRELREALLDALIDPLRNRVYATVVDRPGATVTQIAAHIREPVRRVRHQIDRLLDAGLLAVDAETPRRNTRERHYRALLVPSISDEELESRSYEERSGIARSVARLVVSDIVRAAQHHTFGTHPGHAEVRISAEVDPRGWDQLAEILLRTTGEIEEALIASARRLRAAEEGGTEVILALFLFESSPWEEDEDRGPGPRPSMWLPDEETGDGNGS